MFSSSPPPSKSSSGHVEEFSGYHEVLSSAGEKIERQKEGLERRKRKGCFFYVFFKIRLLPTIITGCREEWKCGHALKL